MFFGLVLGGDRDGFTDLFEKVNRQLDLVFFISFKHQGG